MKQYRTINNLVGWITFIIAATVYCLTIEPTASFWDCPEFITTGYKLEVGHPPGAPFFMLVANLFSQFASDVTTVAKMVNYMSALMSGACILFLFWSITHLVRKLVITDENNITKGQLITVMGSGLVGALVYTFSDTFWFSAVEGEVYAFSSLFTAIVFWLILKWEDVANQPPQRPLADPDRLSDRTEYRCSLAEPPLSAGNRIGVLLQENSERHCQRLIARPARIGRTRSSRALWHRARYR